MPKAIRWTSRERKRKMRKAECSRHRVFCNLNKRRSYEQERPGERQEARAGQNREDSRSREGFPGYPYYGPGEDIMHRSGTGRVRLNVENLTPSGQADGRLKDGPKNYPGEDQTGKRKDAEERGPEPGRTNDTDGLISSRALADTDDPEGDVSEEERRLLEQAGNNADDSDDVVAPLRARPDEQDEDGDLLNEAYGAESTLGEDMDVPGSEDDDANEAIGEEDEENNYYSLGSDDNDNLDTDQS